MTSLKLHFISAGLKQNKDVAIPLNLRFFVWKETDCVFFAHVGIPLTYIF